MPFGKKCPKIFSQKKIFWSQKVCHGFNSHIFAITRTWGWPGLLIYSLGGLQADLPALPVIYLIHAGTEGGWGRGEGGGGGALWVWPLLHLSQATNTVTLSLGSGETHMWAEDVRTSTLCSLKGEFVTWGWRGTRFETWSLAGWRRGTRVESSGWVFSSMGSPLSSRYTDKK
jgi:hypothetical protein